MPVLTAIDVIGIQSYVFASNRLRDVVGASYLVEWATSQDSGKGLDVAAVSKPEIVIAAGGNAILRFDTKSAAKQFVLCYTRRLLDNAPGLDVAIAHHEYAQGQLAHGLLALQVELAKAKLSRRPHTPQLGLSVMQPCAITGLPASEPPERYDEQWVSRRIAKIRANATLQAAKSRWEEFLTHGTNAKCKINDRDLRFPDEIDQMGRTREDTSLVGVVHIDGNGIGKRIQNWLVDKVSNSPANDDELIKDYRNWSKALDDLSKAVFRAVTNQLIDRIEPTDDKNVFFQVRGQPSPPRELDFDLETRDGAILLPLRPILLGGDDLTFVCDGRLALDLAARALKAFRDESQLLNDLKLLGSAPITACAGVALVKAHAPFSRSYELSEALCASAKHTKRDAESSDNTLDTGSWLDWHIGTVRPDESLDDIRSRQYEGKKLTCRPYPLNVDSAPHLTWEWFDTFLLGEPTGDDDKSPSAGSGDLFPFRR